MEDYPKTLIEFESRFSTEEGCRQYLIQLRWPEGFQCPRCGGKEYWQIREMLFQCTKCSHQTSATAGTIFQDTHLPLKIWFRAMWWVTGQKDGASALGLKRVLGCSYKTAWMLLHKFRRAMVRPGRERLSGNIEVDETYLGGLEEGLRGRQIEDKSLIAIAAQFKGKRIGRIRMKRVSDASAESLQGFIQESADAGSTIHTDGWLGYENLERKGYSHNVVILSRNRKSPSDLLPRVHRIASLLKRWLMSTHQGAISREHLDYYLDEYVFRFNRRTSEYRGKLFYRLVQQAAQISPVTFRGIRQNVRGLRHGKHIR
jgi:transposase-like protein/ribosomal protein L37AE/L43A